MLSNARKAKALFDVLSLAPMDESRERFERLAQVGDLAGFWAYYQGCLKRTTTDEGIELTGKVSFRMLKPAMEALYALPSQ